MKRVLVTGGDGFIGRHLIREILQSNDVELVIAPTRTASTVPTPFGNHRVIRPLMSRVGLQDSDTARYLMKHFAPDTVFHLASNPNVKTDSDACPAQIISDNVTTTQNLLAYATEGIVFVNASSVTVYGNKLAYNPDEFMSASPNSVYAATKLASEHLVDVYKTNGRVRGVNLRLVANVGDGSTHGLLHDILIKLNSDSEYLELIGDAPGSSKPYVHVRDTTKAFLLAATQRQWQWHSRVNISVANPLSVYEVAMLVMAGVRLAKPIKWLGEKANWKGDVRQVSVKARLALLLGWKPEFPDSAGAVQQAVKDYVLSHASKGVVACS